MRVLRAGNILVNDGVVRPFSFIGMRMQYLLQLQMTTPYMKSELIGSRS
eukprot:SAG11_NODE_6711_length_1261_cov_1.925990_1_plen_48_part_10